MKTKAWLVLIVALAMAAPVLAAETEAAAPSEAKPKAAAAQKKSASTKPKPAETPEPIFNPEPAVTKQNNVNVRGQASISSEVITHLQKGQPITVLEEITLRKPKADEPAKWYRIALPTNAPVWVHTEFINITNKTVIPNRLNLRGGPGENYSILGRVNKGAVVKEIEVRGDWIRIDPPTNAYAFVAAHLVSKLPSAPPPEPTAKPPETIVAVAPTPAPTPAVDQPAPPPVAPTTPAPATPVTPAPVVIPAPATEPLPPATIEPLPKRIVMREGWVRRTVSPHAPTYFELESRDTKKIINYLYSGSPNIDIKKLKGRLISVTGEESLDERWNTPVITVETLEIMY